MMINNIDNKQNFIKNVAFLTLGCKVNAYETDAMEKLFINAGYNIVTIDEKADIVIINTCTVTNMADRKSRQTINRVRKNNPDAIIVATGCYVQIAKEEILKSGVVDIAVGNNKKNEIVKLVEEHIAQKDDKHNMAIIDINDKQCEYEEMSIDSNMENTRAYVKIQDGCNQFCTYCIIPYARGRIRSRQINDILREVNTLAKNGYKEVVITGIHLSSYGMDFENNDTFSGRDYNPFMFEHLIKVLDEIAKIDGIERIRLGSLEPRIITREFLEKLSNNKKICPHFHLSLQSGCDETLRRMNRKYDTEIYRKGLRLLREYFDNPAITTDVIVGFPKESDEEFEQTYSFLKECNFSMIHVFKYSRRKGTVADRMEGQVKDEIKTIRSNRLLELTKQQHIEYLDSFIGKEEKVLFEEELNNNPEYYYGHNERYIKVAIMQSECLKKIESNELHIVRVEKRISDDVVVGKIIS